MQTLTSSTQSAVFVFRTKLLIMIFLSLSAGNGYPTGGLCCHVPVRYSDFWLHHSSCRPHPGVTAQVCVGASGPGDQWATISGLCKSKTLKASQCLRSHMQRLTSTGQFKRIFLYYETSPWHRIRNVEYRRPFDLPCDWIYCKISHLQTVTFLPLTIEKLASDK